MLRIQFFIWVILSTLSACSNVDRSRFSPTLTAQRSVIASQEDLGEYVAQKLNLRYIDLRPNCRGLSTPSFLCAGIMIRGTQKNPAYHVWNNSPASIAKGGVSFSYLRSDADFNRLAYNYTNGYIFMPILDSKGKLHPNILCSFPTDAWTESRADAGCGEYPAYPGSDLCHLKDVNTAEQWWADYTSHPIERQRWQCGFDVRDSRNTLAGPAFAASQAARTLMGDEGFQKQNEMIVEVWPEDSGKDLPLEAFFYVEGSAEGLADAQYNQQDLKITDDVLIPIIKLRLPISDTRAIYTPDAPATFTYNPCDQTEPMPPAARSRHPASIPLSMSGCNDCSAQWTDGAQRPPELPDTLPPVFCS